MSNRCFIQFIIIIFTICYGSASNASEPIRIFTSIAPQKLFVQQIGKDRVSVQVMVPAGGNPATYEPKPRQMADISKTSLYFAIGVPFENVWLEKIAAANPAMRVIRTDRGIQKIPMAAHHRHGRRDGHPGNDQKNPGGADGSGLDPHIWLSPDLVKIQAATILAALEQLEPSRQNAYRANFHQFIARIDELDARLKSIFAGKQGQQFLVFHPSWGYFANAYGLEQVAIEIEGKDPKPAQLQELIAHALGKGIKMVFVQPQFSTKSAKLIARAIGGQVAFADPLAEDWFNNLMEVAGQFEKVLK